MRRNAVVTVVFAIATAAAGQTVVNVDAAANRHPIDPRIYGVAWAEDTATVNDLGITLNRWGGNAVSRHNWEISTTNRAKDYFFLNIPDDIGVEPIAGGSADKFIGMTRAGANGVQCLQQRLMTRESLLRAAAGR